MTNSENCKCDAPTPNLEQCFTGRFFAWRRVNVEIITEWIGAEPFHEQPDEDMELPPGAETLDVVSQEHPNAERSEWRLICADCGAPLPLGRLSPEQMITVRALDLGIAEGNRAESELIPEEEAIGDIAKGGAGH